MTNAIDVLNEQHKNIAKLIHLVEKEVDRVADEDTPNVGLLLDIMQYLTRYVDVSHHPLEELMMEHYEKKVPSENQEVSECRRQHQRLMELGREFMAVVEAVREEQLVERVEFTRIGSEFVEAQLAHMDLEEGKVFPELRRTLGDQELDEVTNEMINSRDPLFGGIVEKEYQQLYDYILRSA